MNLPPSRDDLVFVEVDLLRKGFKSSRIKVITNDGEKVIIVDNKTLQFKYGKYYVTCSREPIKGGRSIEVNERDIE